MRSLWSTCFGPAAWIVLFALLKIEVHGCPEHSNGSCILPNPQPNLEPGNLEDLWLEASCMLGCVEKYDTTSEILNSNTAWPTMNFSKHDMECATFQKIRECKEGCMVRDRHPATTINRCRDICYLECTSSPPPCIEGDACEGSFCPRSCRKTYCRFGCEVYDETKSSTGSGISLKQPPAPFVAPSISEEMPSPYWKSWLHSTNYDSAALTATKNSSGLVKDYATTACFVRISSSSDNYYIWQKDLDQPLDLSPFACSSVSISFAVISKYRQLSADHIQFSPSVSVCSSGVGGYPNNVTDIQVSYIEDLRESYVGYSIAKVSWAPPNNSQYLTSYTIRVYPCQVRCGGSKKVVYSYTKIDKRRTSFTLQADTNNGLWRFGCSYLVEVVSLPTREPVERTIGAYISTATELATTFPPLVLKCDRIWNEDGNFNISVEWEFPESIQISHIARYILTPSLQSNINGIIRFYNSTIVNSDGNAYSVVTQMFMPQIDNQNMTVVVDVSVEKNHMYYWRTIPQTQSCSVSASPLPPSRLADITVSQLDYNRTTRRLRTTVHLSPPANLHGVLEEYELLVLSSRETCTDCIIERGQRFLSKTSTFEISTLMDVRNTSNCFYLMARASNHYNLSGHWLERIVPLNNECDTTSDSMVGSVLSIVYQREDGTRNSVLDLGCPVTGDPNEGSSKSKLQSIDFKLQDFTIRIQEDSEGSQVKLLSHSQLKLTSIEEKINTMLTILGQSQSSQERR